MKKVCSLLPSNYIGHLDHICPFSALLNITLYTSCKEIHRLIKMQYPEVKAIYLHEKNLYTFLTKEMDIIISTLPRQILDLLFFYEETTLGKTLKKIWLPHGQSDKNNMKALVNEDLMLVYGNKMKSMILEKQQVNCKMIGNYRKQYYDLHKQAYDQLVQKSFENIEKSNNILYAPSFENSSIEQWIESLVKNKPKELVLYIKLHPNTYANYFGESLRLKYEKRPSIIFIENFFAIYPLLQYMSVLFSDISSISYDYLFFKRPMLFTLKNNNPMQQCGSIVNIYSPYDNLKNTCQKKQEDLYRKTFENFCLKKAQRFIM